MQSPDVVRARIKSFGVVIGLLRDGSHTTLLTPIALWLSSLSGVVPVSDAYTAVGSSVDGSRFLPENTRHVTASGFEVGRAVVDVATEACRVTLPDRRSATAL